MSLKKYKTIIYAVLLFILALVIFSYNLRQDAQTGLVKKLILETAAPLQAALNGMIRAVDDSWHRYVYLVGMQKENEELHREIANLRTELNEYREGYDESRRLREHLALQDEYLHQFTAARVIGRDQAAFSRTIVINKGSTQGLSVGMPVIAPHGLVGRLTDVSWHASKVLLLIDESSNVDVMIQRTRTQGILRGAGAHGCVIKYISKREDVKEGDVVISSGMSNFFPRGLPIGIVSHVDEQEMGLFLNIRVMPFVDSTKLEEVQVLTLEHKETQPEALKKK